MKREYHMVDRFILWPLDELCDAVNKIEKYCKVKMSDCSNIVLDEIWKTVSDEPDGNDRIDAEVSYMREKKLYRKKLLIMRGEVIDGYTFHERFKEYYPGR